MATQARIRSHGASDTDAAETDQPVKSNSIVWQDQKMDILSRLQTSSALMAFSDIDGSGTPKLVIVDRPITGDTPIGQRKSTIRVYQGTRVFQQREFAGLAAAMVAFNVAESEGGTAALGIASEDTVFVFVNLKAFVKVTVPGLMVLPEESALWGQIAANTDPATADVDALCEGLLRVRETTPHLSAQSLRLVAMPPAERVAFVRVHRSTPLARRATVTALATLPVGPVGAGTSGAPQCVVVGTEHGAVHVVSPRTFGVVATRRVPAPVTAIHTHGCYDVEYRLFVVCRNGCIYRLKTGESEPVVVELSSQAVGSARVNKLLYTAGMDCTLSCFSSVGRRHWTIPMPTPITAMCVLSYRPRNTKGFVVALSNGDVRVYNERTVVDTFTISGDAVDAMVFGPCGSATRSVLAIVTRKGLLVIRTISPAVDFAHAVVHGGPPPEQSIRIPVPPKTQLYVDNAAREREQARDMHRTFQRHLSRLKLLGAQHYTRGLQCRHVPLVHSARVSVRISLAVLGMGPTFKVVATVVNTAPDALSGLHIVFSSDPTLYAVCPARTRMGLVIPNATCTHTTVVKCITTDLRSGNVHVGVCGPGNVPLVEASVHMPIVSAIAMP
eukprot:m.557883 g.557883  ORF g.557883 m.557883 type:complete len:613 (+) comp22192_c1_seq2:362-2200(+)